MEPDASGRLPPLGAFLVALELCLDIGLALGTIGLIVPASRHLAAFLAVFAVDRHINLLLVLVHLLLVFLIHCDILDSVATQRTFLGWWWWCKGRGLR